MIKNGELTSQTALFIDYFVIYIFVAYCLTLTTALVIFKVLDQRYQIQIKKFQLFICFIFTSCATALSFF